MSGTNHYMLYEETDKKIKKYYLFEPEFLAIKEAKKPDSKNKDLYFDRMGRSFIIQKIKEYGELKKGEGETINFARAIFFCNWCDTWCCLEEITNPKLHGAVCFQEFKKTEKYKNRTKKEQAKSRKWRRTGLDLYKS